MDELKVLLLSEYDRRIGKLRRGPLLRLLSPPPHVRYFVLQRSKMYEAPANYSELSPLELLSSLVRQASRILRTPLGEGFDLVHSFFIDLTRTSAPWIHESDESPGQYLDEYVNVPDVAKNVITGTLVDRLVDDNCRAVVTWSKWAHEGFVRDGVPSSKVHVIPPPVSVKSRRPHDAVNILIIARDPIRKGLDLSLKAFVRIHRYFNNVRLIVVGPKASRLTKVGLKGIRAFDRVDDDTLHNVIMPTTDVVLAPSRAEAYNLTVLEAMAYGAVPIVTNVGALPELVGEAGLIIERDDYDMLADSLEKLVSDQSLRESLSLRAQEVVRRDHDPEVIGESLLKVYRQALEG
ncbi:glycosyltransferase family 4 protein [Acidilobus sp.]|uniref:glycosyltransferase family 4 protein n=1 Tax=Acidilobus sp. TaxID=1872109 RepID=UPI003D0354EE